MYVRYVRYVRYMRYVRYVRVREGTLGWDANVIRVAAISSPCLRTLHAECGDT